MLNGVFSLNDKERIDLTSPDSFESISWNRRSSDRVQALPPPVASHQAHDQDSYRVRHIAHKVRMSPAGRNHEAPI
jgi:hypothetical protein